MGDKSWKLVKTDLYERRLSDFRKRRMEPLKAVLQNLQRYTEMLEAQPHASLITANFIHNEHHGVISLDQRGYKPKQPATRFYLYPDQQSCTLYLITIGDKHTQHQDIKDCHKFIKTL